jgi:hypothetical protein
MTVNVNAALWTTIALRNEVMERFGIPSGTWYYHTSRAGFPQPDVEIAGNKMYSDERAQEVLAFFAAKARTKK